MNLNDDSNNATQSPVTSKYFKKKNEMDGSLTDFKETKKSVIGPKNTKASNKAKPKRVPKRIKGQKDIRAVLKTKKNELVQYTEEFQDVCKKSGIDVDAEQLQVLIALSKSLQPDTDSVNSRSRNLNSQERKSKIRTTLQEYGFKVPEIKIADKKVKKYRKQYKLLTKTDVEKQQIISDRYSQVLLQNFDIFNLHSSLKDSIPLYNIATNAVYDVIKDNSVYYVNDLVERTNTSGCLFKDYANIPGRPVSPKLFQEPKMNFSEIECSQDELDIVLSGTFKRAKNILNSKQKSLHTVKDVNTCRNSMNVEQKCEEIMAENSITIETGYHGMFQRNEEYMNCDGIREWINEEKGAINSVAKQLITITQTKQYRSCSPDIFDDEVSCILDDDVKNKDTKNNCSVLIECDNNLKDSTESKNRELKNEISLIQLEASSSSDHENKFGKNKISQSTELNENTKNISDKFADINVTLKVKECMSLSQKSKTTMRKSNEYMDLTECIHTNNYNTRLSQSDTTKRKSNDFMEITECINAKTMDHIDLTQNNNETNIEENKGAENIDLTQSSNSNDELPLVCLSGSHSLDTTVILDENEYFIPIKNLIAINKSILDLPKESMKKKINESIFDDFIHDHSEPSTESTDIKTSINLCHRISVSSNGNVEVQIDLSQVSSKSDELSTENFNIETNTLRSSLESGERTTLKTPTKFNEIFDTNIVYDTTNKHHSYVSPKYKYITNEEIDLTQSSNAINIEDTYKCCIFPESSDNERYDIDLTQSSDSTDKESDVSENTNKLECNKIEPFTPRTYGLLNSLNTTSKENEGCTTSGLLINSIENENCDMDLTQDNYKYCDSLKTCTKSPRNSSLCKKDNISIDYDEMYDRLHRIEENNEREEDNECVTFHHVTDINCAFENDEHSNVYYNVDRKSNIESNCSQSSEVFEISDKEFDYSLNKSTYDNFETSSLSIMNNISKTGRNKIEPVKNKQLYDNDLSEVDLLKDAKIDSQTTPRVLPNSKSSMKTPVNSEYIIKTDEVTPMLNYAALSTPERNRELDKYGLKPLKRKRAIQLLTHLYNQTHPIVESLSEDFPTPSKKLCISKTQFKSPDKLDLNDGLSQKTSVTYKNIDNDFSSKSPGKNFSDSSETAISPKKKCGANTPRKDLKSPRKVSRLPRFVLDGEVSKENVYEVTSEVPSIKNIVCEDDDLMFQKREKAKIHSCRVPLHIALHNYVSSRNGVREAILRYEPVNIDTIHRELVSYGHRYDPKDLLKFMDKKCITVKTSDNNARNERC